MTSERLFNSFIHPQKFLYPPKQISGYAPGPKIIYAEVVVSIFSIVSSAVLQTAKLQTWLNCKTDGWKMLPTHSMAFPSRSAGISCTESPAAVPSSFSSPRGNSQRVVARGFCWCWRVDFVCSNAPADSPASSSWYHQYMNTMTAARNLSAVLSSTKCFTPQNIRHRRHQIKSKSNQDLYSAICSRGFRGAWRMDYV